MGDQFGEVECSVTGYQPSGGTTLGSSVGDVSDLDIESTHTQTEDISRPEFCTRKQNRSYDVENKAKQRPLARGDLIGYSIDTEP